MPITYNLIIVIPAIQQGMIVAAWEDPGTRDADTVPALADLDLAS